MTDFVHLHCHGEYSVLDGTGSAEKYAQVASGMGFTALALTDHGNIDGVIRHQKACVSNNLDPIIGCELYVVEDLTDRPKGEKRSHMTVLCKNEVGYKNLLKMLTTANIEGFYRSPRVDPELVLEHYEGLVFMSACFSTPLWQDWGKEMFLDLNEVTECFLEIMPHQLKLQKDTNELKMKFHKDYGIPLVATQDAHYPLKEDSKSQEVLLAIQRNSSMYEKPTHEGGKRFAFEGDTFYLTTEHEVRKEFKKQNIVSPRKVNKAIKNTKVVADLCRDFRIKDKPVDLPSIPQVKGKDEFAFLEDLIWEGFDHRLAKLPRSKTEEYEDRVLEELELIKNQKFEKYFLMVWELLDWCKKNNIMYGPGRGSVGGSMVAYLLYITDVDPIKHRCLFSRFLSPGRIDLPDIDLDFEHTKRDMIREHLQDLYGKYNVCGVSTYLTMKAKMVLKDVSRAYNVPYGDVDKVNKTIDDNLTEAFENNEDAKNFYDDYPDICDVALTLEGQVRGGGQHAAAMCISKDDLREGERAVLTTREGTLVCNWDKYFCESQGLMKLDVLGLKTLSALNECRRLIKLNHDVDVSFEDLELNDKKVYQMISQGLNVGLFQFGSPGLMKYCQQIKPKCFEDIVATTALYRPGPLESGQSYEYIDRRNGEKWKPIHPIVGELTKDTHGIIIYQEQVMLLCNELAGFTWPECDKVRKIMAKSQGGALFAEWKKKFVDGCSKNKTLDEDQAEEMWLTLESFGRYGFNRSHSVEYSMITYWTAWCKANYAPEFMAAMLTYAASTDEEIALYVEECRKMGLTLEFPKVGISEAYKWTTKDKKLYIPFIQIKGIGDALSESIARSATMHVRKGFFGQEVYYSDEDKKPNKTQMASLERIKAFVNDPVTIEESEQLNDLFKFDASKDPMRSVRGIYNILCNQLNLIEDWEEECEGPHYLFGFITYSDNKVLNVEHSSGFRMLSVRINQETYDHKSDYIDHCLNSWCLMEVNGDRYNPSSIIFEKELTSCDFDLPIELIRKVPKRKKVDVHYDCNACKLGCGDAREAQFTSYRKNIMVLTEKPISDKIYDFLEEYIDMEEYHLTSIVKCLPDKGKKATDSQINSCYEEWLVKEIEKVQPKLILTFGNTAMKIFKGVDKGIMEQSGVVEWDRDFNCWICYSMNAGMAMYDDELQIRFEEVMDTFLDCIENINGDDYEN